MKKEKGKGKAMVGFHIDESYKNRIVEIADSFDQETMSDVVEAILKAFFTVNPDSKGKKKGRQLVILKRKGLL